MSSRKKALNWRGGFDCLEARLLLSLTLVPQKVSATQNTPFSAELATLFDTNLNASPTDFTLVQINWGDNQTSTGTVVGPVVAPGVFQVNGTHTYAQAGTYSTTITVADSSGQNANIIGTATVATLPFSVEVNAISAAPGDTVPSSGPLAVFLSPTSADNTPSDFSALINWGDAQTTIGTIGGGPSAFTVSGTHTYASAASFTATVTVAAVNGPTSFGQAQATITSPPVYTSTSQLIVIPVSQLFSGTVATFTDPNASDSASIFTASIDWGDGSTTPATVTGSNGNFTVSGAYTYPVAGPYTATVTVADQSGNIFTVADTVNVTTTNLSNGAVFLTGGLADVSGNGPNASSGYTDNNRPLFSGTTVPYAVVELYARLSGVDATSPLGQAVATVTGQWSFTSGPLADGIYTISATVTPPAGFPSGPIPLTNNGQVVIDTVSPQVVKQTVVGRGRVEVSFRDDLSGLDTTSLLNASNYTFAGPGMVAIHPNTVSLLPSGNLPTDAEAVLLTIKAKPRLLHHIRALRISGTNYVSGAQNVTVNDGIIDNAGNALLGTFYIPANPASGRAAGNYVMKFAVHGIGK